MEGEGEEGLAKVSKRFGDKDGEVDYKRKSGTAWSHSFLNQKPWHPLSYPNQRRKWIAEQTHAQRLRRAEDVAREYAQEQDFLRQTSLLSHNEKQKVDMMQAVSFMYIRPPGYNAESAKAAEIVDEKRKLGASDTAAASSSSVPQEGVLVKEEKKKSRPKDVFGRTLPTEEEFAVLKNAPRLETGVAGRAKPFAVEVRNVKCVRCGTFGHQSGDRECPMKDAIMPNDESRLKRDDPLTAIVAQMDPSEPLKWELKQKPGISPPRGGFRPDDPNQQIVAEDIFDEYGGFLSGGIIPDLLTSFSSKKQKTKKSKIKSKHKKHRSSKRSDDDTSSDTDDQKSSIPRSKSKNKKHRSSKQSNDDTSSAGDGQRSLIPRSKSKHKKHTSSQRSDDDTFSDNDDQRSSLLRSKRKHKKHKSSKRSDGDTNSDSDDQRSSRPSSAGDDQRSLIPRSKSKHKTHKSSKRSDGDACSDYDDQRSSLPRSKSKHKSSKRSDGDTNSDSDDQRSSRPRSKIKQRKRPSTKQSPDDDSHTSASDSDENAWKRKSVSRHKHSKQALHKDSGEFSDGASDDSRNRRSRKFSDVASDDSRNRRSRKERSHKSEKSKRYLSHSSISKDSENEKFRLESRHNDLRHNHSHQVGLDSNKRRNGHSPRRQESRKPYVDRSSDGERKSSRKDKNNRKYEGTKSDTEFSSLEHSECERKSRRKTGTHRSDKAIENIFKSSSSEDSESERRRKKHRYLFERS